MLQLQLRGRAIADSVLLLADAKMVPLNTPRKKGVKGGRFRLKSRSYCV